MNWFILIKIWISVVVFNNFICTILVWCWNSFIRNLLLNNRNFFINSLCCSSIYRFTLNYGKRFLNIRVDSSSTSCHNLLDDDFFTRDLDNFILDLSLEVWLFIHLDSFTLDHGCGDFYGNLRSSTHHLFGDFLNSLECLLHDDLYGDFLVYNCDWLLDFLNSCSGLCHDLNDDLLYYFLGSLDDFLHLLLNQFLFINANSVAYEQDIDLFSDIFHAFLY